MKDFGDYEMSGRKKYEANTTTPHRFTENEFDYWDVSSTSNTKTFNIEIKDRDIEYTKYESDGYWLEKTKYTALMEAYTLTGSIPIYLNFFKNNIAFYWDLRKIEPVWVSRAATKNTANGTYGKEKVMKTVTFVYPKDGIKIKYKNA